MAESQVLKAVYDSAEEAVPGVFGSDQMAQGRWWVLCPPGWPFAKPLVPLERGFCFVFGGFVGVFAGCVRVMVYGVGVLAFSCA